MSELKTAVFAITQSFNRAVPLEGSRASWPRFPLINLASRAGEALAELHLQQLIVEYALLKRNSRRRRPLRSRNR